MLKIILFLFLIGNTSLFAETSFYEYEQSGDYAKALKVALNSNADTLEIERLEDKILQFGFSRLLFDELFQPRLKLLQLLKMLGSTSNNLTDMNHWAQKNLLRQGERWEQQIEPFEELKPKIMPLLIDLGFVEETSSHFREYQGAIVHGALLPRVRLRIHCLLEQWKAGVRFSHLYFLSSERPLENLYKNRNALLNDEESLLQIREDWKEPHDLPKTESEMIQFVWEQSEIPKEMRQINVYFINAPLKGEERLLPNTDDTVRMWLQSSPPKGRYLAITNAPYTNRQDLVIRTLAPFDYCFDTIGSGACQDEQISIYLDELARLIFQTKHFSEKKKFQND